MQLDLWFFHCFFFVMAFFRCQKNELEDAKIARDLRFVDIFLGWVKCGKVENPLNDHPIYLSHV